MHEGLNNRHSTFFSHFDNYITKAYLETLSNAGVNYLRIPVGYWMFDVTEEEPFPPPPTSDDEGRRYVAFWRGKFKHLANLNLYFFLAGFT